MKATRVRQRGYTAVEVIMAMTLFAIGGAGVIAMEKASIQGELDARQQDVAVIIARQWSERFKRDASVWGMGKTPGDSASRWTVADTAWLKDTPVDGSRSGWLKLARPTPAAGNSPVFDTLGQEVPDGTAAAYFFCMRYRTQVYQTRLDTNGAAVPAQIRLETRVYWPRNGNPPGDANYCDTSDASFEAADAATKYRFVQMTTAVVEATP